MRFVIWLLLLSTSLFASETPTAAQSLEELQTQLEKILETSHLPGVSVAIVNREGPLWVKGLGLSNVAEQAPATANTLFRIGSTSKAFTSLAILQLVEQGKLSLEDPVRALAPEVWFENRWEESEPVRVVHLLEHTTGWDDTHLREYALSEPAIGLLDALDYDHTSRISRWPPGTRMAYCNSGTQVAAYIVEKIAGQPFEAYVQEHLFTPLGMKTATYFQPVEGGVTTYQADGITPYPYWHFAFRPAGSINASAQDMAAYLRLYLQRGSIEGKQLVSAQSLERMERPTSTWAAKAGLQAGYGLSNYTTVHDGFVYQGHDGGLMGALTNLAYMPDLGVGYFYSINSDNWEAYQEIGQCIRAYLTRNLAKPIAAPVRELSPKALEYAGWYQADSPRVQLLEFLERLLGIAHVKIEDGQLSMTVLGKKLRYLPVSDLQFRYAPVDEAENPIPTLALLPYKPEGQFIQMNKMGLTPILKRIPAWLAISKIALTGFVFLSLLSVLLYAPIWGLGGLLKRRRRPQERAMRLWPLAAVLILQSISALVYYASSDLLIRLGTLTPWSFALCAATLLFAFTSAASFLAALRAPSEGVRRGVRVYSTLVATALMITTLYLSYWGIIGLRTWV